MQSMVFLVRVKTPGSYTAVGIGIYYVQHSHRGILQGTGAIAIGDGSRADATSWPTDRSTITRQVALTWPQQNKLGY